MKIAFSILLLFQLVIAGCRFYLIDILGGVVLTLTAVFGILVVRFDFLLTWLFPYAMICTVNGLFGSVLIIERLIKQWGVFPALDQGAPVAIRDIQVIVAPVLDVILAGLSFYIIRRLTSFLVPSADDERQPLTRPAPAPPHRSSFTPFAGTGRKLSSN